MERLKTIKGALAYAGKSYLAKKEEMPVMEQKPGRYWGVIGRKHLPFGKREDRQVSANEAVKLRRVMRRVPCGEHAARKAEISANEPIVVAGFHGRAVLQFRVLA